MIFDIPFDSLPIRFSGWRFGGTGGWGGNTSSAV